MRILVSGATGLVGQSLLEKAMLQGHQIHYLTTRKNQLNAIAKAQGFYWNPAKGEIDTQCFDGVDAIIHLAGASIAQRWTKKNKKAILDSRVEGTSLLAKSLNELSGKHNIKQVVSASAIGIYPSSATAVYTEDYIAHPNTFLEKVVIQWEQAADAFQTAGVGLCKLRIGLVLTKEGGILGPMKIPTSFGLGAAFGTGKQMQSWIHVDDLVALFLQATVKGWEGIYNAVSPQSISQNDFAKTLSKAMRRPYFLPAVPSALIRLVAGEMSVLVFNSQQVSAKKIQQKGFEFTYPDLLPAMQSLL